MKLWVKHYFALLLTLSIVWTISFVIISSTHFIVDPVRVWSIGLLNELLFSSFLSLAISPVYLIKNQRFINIFISTLLCAIVLFEMVSSFYYEVTLTPIDRTILKINTDQLSMIAGDFVVFRWFYLFLMLPPILFLTFLKLMNNFPFTKWIITLWFIGLFSSLIFGFQMDSGKSVYKSLGHNKSFHFIHSIFSEDKGVSITKEKAVEIYQNTEGRAFIDPTYPLLHEPSASNPLAPFFHLKSTPPNIVLIIIESLSSSFSGMHADEISYTPFLDSLSEHSLYFENTLATGERTFAALPSILGSLPHGEKGFTMERIGFPHSNSLVQELKQLNYSTHFFYGGNSRFDYMDLYLEDQEVEHINDHDKYRTEDIVKIEGKAPTPFGDSDKELFEKLKHYNHKKEAPYLDIVLTLSMHYPFIVEKQASYVKEFKAVLETSSSTEKVKEKHRKYADAFASMLYTDDVLKAFFRNRELSEEHTNTIYLITGDHMMTDIPHINSIEKYRVPLLIYSPLLKRKKYIKATNSHLDITPSLLRLINEKYSLPEKNQHWLGKPFDTMAQFRNNRSILFMRNNRTTKDLLTGEFYYSDNELFSYSGDSKLKKVKDQGHLNKTKRIFEAYKKLHEYTVNQNRIAPSRSGDLIVNQRSLRIPINDGQEFQNVLSKTIDNSCTSMEIKIDLSLIEGWSPSSLEVDEDQPLLIVALKGNEGNKVWGVLKLDLAEERLDKKQAIHYLIKENSEINIQEGDELSVYFWNKTKSNKLYTSIFHNIKVFSHE